MRLCLAFLFLLPTALCAQDTCYNESEYTTFLGLLVVDHPEFPTEYLAGVPHSGSWADTTGLLSPGTTGLLVQVRDPGDPDAPNGPAAPDLGCAPLTNVGEVAGHIAFMERGGCQFGLKALHAQDAGARGFVIRDYWSPTDELPTYPTHMMGGTYGMEVFIPGLIISYRDGRDLNEAVSDGASVEATLRYCDPNAVSAEDTLHVDHSDVSPAYPNPFVERTRFDFTSDETQHLTAAVYDVLGRRIAVLYEGVVAARTTQRVEFDAHDLPAGVYFVRFAGETFSDVRRVIRTR
jgi:hypothetical protein